MLISYGFLNLPQPSFIKGGGFSLLKFSLVRKNSPIFQRGVRGIFRSLYKNLFNSRVLQTKLEFFTFSHQRLSIL